MNTFTTGKMDLFTRVIYESWLKHNYEWFVDLGNGQYEVGPQQTLNYKSSHEEWESHAQKYKLRKELQHTNRQNTRNSVAAQPLAKHPMEE